MGVQTRATDIIARFGGEEFVIVTPDACLEVAVHVSEGLRACIADAKFALADSTSFAMSCSFGVALVGEGEIVADILACSDTSFRPARNGGHNCLIVAALAVDADAQSG